MQTKKNIFAFKPLQEINKYKNMKIYFYKNPLYILKKIIKFNIYNDLCDISEILRNCDSKMFNNISITCSNTETTEPFIIYLYDPDTFEEFGKLAIKYNKKKQTICYKIMKINNLSLLYFI